AAAHGENTQNAMRITRLTLSPRTPCVTPEAMLRTLLALALIWLFSTAAGADEEKTFEQKALEAGDALKKHLDATAEAIDITLAGKKYTEKPNETEVDISQMVTSTEGGVVKPSTDFSVNLKLPNVERAWQLRFTSYDQEAESRDLSQQHIRTRAHDR